MKTYDYKGTKLIRKKQSEEVWKKGPCKGCFFEHRVLICCITGYPVDLYPCETKKTSWIFVEIPEKNNLTINTKSK